MRSSQKQLLAISLVLGIGVLAFLERVRLHEVLLNLTQPSLPDPSAYTSPTATPRPSVSSSTTPHPSPTEDPKAVNLDIPFVSQAPHMIWDADHEEFCEEAAALMAASYINGDHSVTNPDVAEAELQKVKTYELQTFGYFQDTTAAETARILREHFHLTAVKVVANPTVAQIKGWVAQGKAVLVPSAGRQLGNPNFKAPGPLYHMVVIKGYTSSNRFITNDPGTRKGADYIYDTEVIMNAMHDWNGGNVENGQKVVIVVG